MRVLISGASGLIGSALVPALERNGDQVLRLVRRPPRPGIAEARWDPATGVGDPAALEGIEAVVHLAGESIAARRWTPAVKEAIRDSRVRGTRVLCESLARLARPPRVLVSTSAMGYYGDCGDEVLTEASGPGSGFLPEVAVEWERACDPARAAGIRVVHPRIALVLTRAGGALARLLTPARFGLGGPIGNGRQFWSWIMLRDLVAVLRLAIERDSIEGAVNAASPAPVRQAEFARTLGRVLRRPAFLPAPAFALRLLLGELANELLTSARLEPARLREEGFAFQDPELEPALRRELG
jgi:uncharacterized protein (TIGR01777 family)